MLDEDDNDEMILQEMRGEKQSLKSVLNKKKLTKWEMDEALAGEA
jgi:hypothetical protein